MNQDLRTKSGAKKKFNIYQIFYDDITKNSLDAGFIPLDNMVNSRPDWYEFWVILNFLENEKLDSNNWYGFLSPKFRLKTGLTSANVYEFMRAVDLENFDVAIVSPDWDRGAYYLNPFEQGDAVHPGLLDLSQAFLSAIGVTIDLNKLVSHSQSTVFCNYIIAKPAYWKRWHKIAKEFFKFVENGKHHEAFLMAQNTSYPSPSKLAPMKTFIQERFPSIILADTSLRVANLNLSEHLPIFQPLFNESQNTRRQLQTCDSLKQRYVETEDAQFLEAYYSVRSLISTKF